MKSHLTEILGIAGAILVTILAWRYGGQQQNENKREQTLYDGTDTVVNSFKELIAELKEMTAQERERVQMYKEMNHDCEVELREVKRRLDEIEKRQNSIDK